jgi:aminoglycoside phosphotransferase (APT) family kinase protein
VGLADGLSAFLEEQWGEPVEVSGLAASSAGARRANISFDANGRGLVATIMPTAAIQLNRISAEAEVRILARARGVPVPEIIGWSEDDKWVGGPFFVSERVEGETVPRQVLRLVDKEGIGERVAHQLGVAMAQLHTIRPDDAPADLLDLGPGNPAEMALKALSVSMKNLLEPRPTLTLANRWLTERLPDAPAQHALVHTDIRNGNLIVGADGLRAILDWEGARRSGDPMEDAAWVALRMWRFRNDDREIGGFAGVEPFAEGYGSRFDMERFRWWKVYGTFKWAIGLAGQAGQFLDGSFRNIVMAASGRRVVEMEWDLLMLMGRDG